MSATARQRVGVRSDALGARVNVAIPEAGCSVAEARAAIAAAHPALAQDMASRRVRACVDDSIVGDDAWVTPAQSLALFPPVSGG